MAGYYPLDIDHSLTGQLQFAVHLLGSLSLPRLLVRLRLRLRLRLRVKVRVRVRARQGRG